jgi:hypothetical protein
MEIKWNRVFVDEQALDDYVYKQLRRIEAHTKEKLLNPHNPGGSSGLTIGVGYDVKKGYPAVRRGVLKGIGLQTDLLDIQDPAGLSASEKIEYDYIEKLQDAMANGKSLKAINDILSQRANDEALKDAMKTEGKNYELRSKLKFENEGEVRAAFGDAVKAYKDDINRFVRPETVNDPSFHLSREKAALIVVSWLNPALARSVSKTENRAEAWHKIRYGWAAGKGENAQFNIGWAKRRYIESEMLGLYNDRNNVSLDEAIQVYRMFQKHRDEIAGYEKLHGHHGSVKTEKWRRTAFEEANYGKKEVKTVAESFAPAKAVILAAIQEQCKDNPKLVAKLTDDINHFRQIDNHLNALKEVEKQPLKAQAEPQPVYAAKETVQHQKENVQPEGGFLSKIGEMGQRMHDSDVEAAKAQTQIPELIGSLLDKMFSPANSDASEISPLKMNRQIMNKADEQYSDYRIVPAGELRKTASDALYAMHSRELEIRKFINENYGRPMKEAEIETAAVFSHLTEKEQTTVETAAKLMNERANIDEQTKQRHEVAEAYGYNRFYAKIPNFLKNDHQKRYDCWGKDLEQKNLELREREEANRAVLEKTLAKISTPEFQEKKARTMAEIKASDVKLIRDLDSMGSEWETFTGRRFSINYLMDKLPERIGRLGIGVKGDPKDIENLLAQSDQIAAQTKPAIEMSRQYARGVEWS